MPRKLKIKGDKMRKGDSLVEIDKDQALLFKASGKLQLCRCVRHAWDCEKIDNNTVCYQVCVEWDCDVEIPAEAVFSRQ